MNTKAKDTYEKYLSVWSLLKQEVLGDVFRCVIFAVLKFLYLYHTSQYNVCQSILLIDMQ